MEYNINIINLDDLFFDCQSLKTLPDLSKWNIFNDKINLDEIIKELKQIKKLNQLQDKILNEYKELNNLDGISDYIFDFENNPNICSPYINIRFKYKNGLDYLLNDLENKRFSLTGIFSGCSSLKYLPNISKWNTVNVKNISLLFCGCSSLKELPDISKWKTNNIEDISFLLYNCSSLKSLPDIFKWNTKNIIKMDFIFSGCLSLETIPDISNWDVNNFITRYF